MKTAVFINWSNEHFKHAWDSEVHNFPIDAKKRMPDWLAAHFAKHLTNRELIKAGHETETSPKDPSRSKLFMEFFNKAYIEDITEDMTSVRASIVDLNSDVTPAKTAPRSKPISTPKPKIAQTDVIGEINKPQTDVIGEKKEDIK